jgi:hypothetical protein
MQLFSATGTSVAMNLDGAVIDSSVIGGTTAAAGYRVYKNNKW